MDLRHQLCNHLPRGAHMFFARPHISNCEPRSQFAVQARVRNKDLPRRVHPIDQRLISASPAFSRKHTVLNGTGATTSNRGSDSTSEANTFASRMCSRITALQSLDTVMPDDHPELQCTKAAAELKRVVHGIGDRVTFGGFQVFRRETERTPQHFRTAAVESAQVHRRQQPLVRIGHKGIRAIAALQDVPHVPAESPPIAGVGRVHVQPQLDASRTRPRCALLDRCSSWMWFPLLRQPQKACTPSSRSAAIADSSASDIHSEFRVRSDLHQTATADTERHGALLDRRMGLLRRIHSQHAATSRPADSIVPHAASGNERSSRAAASAWNVDIDAVSQIIPLKESGSPIICRSQSRTCSSSSVAAGAVRHSIPLTLSAAVSISPKDPGLRTCVRKVREERRMIPMRQAGNDDPIEILENPIKGLGSLRWRRGSCFRISPGFTCERTACRSGCDR